MKITDRFIGDHKTFRKMMGDIELQVRRIPQEWEQKRLIRLVELFKDHLILHAWGEETFYYPVLKSRLPVESSSIDRSYMDQLDAEHKIVDGLIDQLEIQVKSDPIPFDWIGTFQSFQSGLNAHMAKEENELFPFSEGLLGANGLSKISDELERRRKEAPAIRRHSKP